MGAGAHGAGPPEGHQPGSPGFGGRGGRELEATVERESDVVAAEPAIAAPEALPAPAQRPSLQPVRRSGGEARTVDLTAEDDTQALPRLDSLERKLKDLEQQFG